IIIKNSSCKQHFSVAFQPIMSNNSDLPYQKPSQSRVIDTSTYSSELMLSTTQPKHLNSLSLLSSSSSSSSLPSLPTSTSRIRLNLSNSPQSSSQNILNQPLPSPVGLERPPILRSLNRRFSPPFKPFSTKDADADSIGSSDSPITMSPLPTTDSSSHQLHNDPPIIPLTSSDSHPQDTKPFINSTSHLITSNPQIKSLHDSSLFSINHKSHHDALSDSDHSDADEANKVHFIESTVKLNDDTIIKKPKRTAEKANRYKPSSVYQSRENSNLTSPQSIKPSRTSTRPINLYSSRFRDSDSKHSDHDLDEDFEGIASKVKSKGRQTVGRAAKARRAMMANSKANGSWISEETPIEPVPSSSTTLITSPRLRSTRRTSPGTSLTPARLSGSESPGTGDETLTVRPEVDSEKANSTKNTTSPALTKSSRPKRPKASLVLNVTAPTAPPDTTDSTNNLSPKNEPIKRRVATLMPATEPDESGQYESSTCHQCRVKTTRPKMICDQSQDPNCVVRVCHTCLMIRNVYNDMPELRPPIFEFVPGGTMLCVKCRDICPCASCRRRRGEKEQCRRGLGSGLKGFYGMTPEEREIALTKKKEKQEAARLRKEARPPSEKKTPVICRREVTSIRSYYDDDEHERLQHWAPLPVFPPLPKRRKKKRKRLEVLEGVPLDCQARNTDSNSSCSDSDSNEETESDSRSLSSLSSFHSNTQDHILGSASFQLPLSSDTRQTIPLLPKRWRSNPSQLCKDDPVGFSTQLYQAVRTKPKHLKAPVVWIKSGAMIQARKPPTTEFMQKLAEEQKGRLGYDVTDESSINLSAPIVTLEHPSTDLDFDMIENKVEEDGFQTSHSMDLDRPPTPVVITQSSETAKEESQLAVSMINNDQEIKLDSSTLNHDQVLNGSEKVMTDQHATTMESIQPNITRISDSLESRSETRLNETGYTTEMAIKSFQTDTSPNPSSAQGNCRPQFEQGAFVDHESYFAGLTNEQLRAVLKQGNLTMTKQGFLSSNLASDELAMKFPGHQDGLTAGISPELISASLPLNGGEELKIATDQDSLSAGPMVTDLTEEEQELRILEAANWAAVWGVTDGLGGFSMTRDPMDPEGIVEGNQNIEKINVGGESGMMTNASDRNSQHDRLREFYETHPNGERDLLLRAMKSCVGGDEWLTDIMPLDNC
ncbi:hypothetical protein O181_052777, partial [Austropuccinia psidii MF-1]|nr:hypothetical protein [Austropuccinia psidii MF-1]